MRTLVEEKLNVFILTLEQRQPYFSIEGTRSIQGNVTPQSRERARQVLLPKVLMRSDNFAVQVLQEILNPRPIISPELKKKLGDW